MQTFMTQNMKTVIEPTNNRRPITRTKIPGWDKDQRAFRASLRLQTTAGRFGSTRTSARPSFPTNALINVCFQYNTSTSAPLQLSYSLLSSHRQSLSNDWVQGLFPPPAEPVCRLTRASRSRHRSPAAVLADSGTERSIPVSSLDAPAA